jgi:integrase
VQVWVEDWLKRQMYTEAVKDLARVRAWLPRTRLAKLPLADVTPQIVGAWLRELSRLPSARGTPPAPRTLRNVVDPVSRALRYAVFEQRLAQDPFAVIPSELRPQSVDADPTKRRRRRLSQVDVMRLLSRDEIPVDRRVLYLLLFLSGTRMSEAVALRWSDVTSDLPLDRLTIAEQWHQRLKARTPTKTDAVREVPVHPELRRVLTWWHAGGWARWYGRAPTAADLIVPTRAHRQRASVGKCRRQGAVYREFQADLLGAEIPPHRVHDTRHTFVSLCADAGVTAEVATRWTHAGRTSSSAVEIYRTPSWARQCEEMSKLTITCTLGIVPAE